MKSRPHLAPSALRAVIITGGIGASILFVLVGVICRLQLFGDGSIFSYAVAAQDAWAFHWHNISGRLFTYFLAYPLAEAVVAMSQNAEAGIAVYGILFFSAQLFGLALTFVVDRTSNRTIFTYACLSTVCLCPFVYGFPTEMWMAHAVFWPTLALSLGSPISWRGAAAVFAALVALVFTHEGAIVLSAVIIFTLLLRGWRDAKFVRTLCLFLAVLVIWGIVKQMTRPDDYIAGVLAAAAFKIIDIRNLAQPAFVTVLAALLGYAGLIWLLRWMNLPKAQVFAVAVCAATLGIYWIKFDHSVLTDARYDLRTLLLIMTAVFGIFAAVHAMNDAERRSSWFPPLAQWTMAIETIVNPGVIAGALLLTILVHTVETSKFVLAWRNYGDAVRALATGTASDPQLGSPLFVSSHRIDSELNRVAWNSTTPYLSVLVAPRLAPTRLVVDPDAGYFWLSCQTARQSEASSTAVPAATRRLVRIYACLHR